MDVGLYYTLPLRPYPVRGHWLLGRLLIALWLSHRSLSSLTSRVRLMMLYMLPVMRQPCVNTLSPVAF